ncbi:helix-turn-helix domain-containing protein [Clostridioides difficile]|uniref:helix-turn-helix domain-containing protein n=1 Tax=Clostridioides difficile TaxID=1496 RepID=UPI0003B1C95B|nr:helix-turn-helix transcriptional regulator [Clostridioides difficile]EGT4786332.1 XRE family transcriptional regulator [Clostridioides difficile]EII6798185.1 helix-turn-helix transcriptional regulator [Clostridioides difficile]EKS6818675.1 helix-turn-helix transcriptional regulator [Clostridioides difficile]ERM22955.1 helix-turn-helix family protein [Clostridioides difficile P41]MBY1073681.1 helix-turn-helix transcriptional regulator [Clostridioides difficile]
MAINDNINEILRDRDLKAWKLAKEIGVDSGNLYAILRGKNKNPTIDTLIKIADYLDVTLDELVGR